MSFSVPGDWPRDPRLWKRSGATRRNLVGWRGLLLCTVPFLVLMLVILVFVPKKHEPAAESADLAEQGTSTG